MSTSQKGSPFSIPNVISWRNPVSKDFRGDTIPTTGLPEVVKACARQLV